jgi:acetate kinase
MTVCIPVAVSARHAHLCANTIGKLFGKGYALQKRAELSQHGQYSAQETISLIGPQGRIDHVRLMGPPRAEDQVEISRSDEFVLGVEAPVRLSGHLEDTPGITLEGPAGRVTIPKGVICAQRHIHMSPTDAQRLGTYDGDFVDVKIDSDGRDLTFSDVIVRVDPKFELELHLDTDEANAAGVRAHQQGELVTRATVRGEIRQK